MLDWGNSSASALELLWSCVKPLICVSVCQRELSQAWISNYIKDNLGGMWLLIHAITESFWNILSSRFREVCLNIVAEWVWSWTCNYWWNKRSGSLIFLLYLFCWDKMRDLQMVLFHENSIWFEFQPKYWGLNKMAEILHTTFSNAFFSNFN